MWTTRQSTSTRITTVPPTLEATVTTLTLVVDCKRSNESVDVEVEDVVVVVTMREFASGIISCYLNAYEQPSDT
jgi:hypothetical protein